MKFLVVLGGGVDENEDITNHSKLRHDVGIKLQNEYDYIICSSYKTYKEKAKNQIKSEAKAGKEYLVKMGVSSDKILLEEKSKDTFSNAYYTRELLENLKFDIKKITIVTSKFHMPKTKVVFEIVFPKKEYNINYIESENGDINPLALKNRINNETEVIAFYNEHLEKTYGVISGDMKSIQNFIENHNPSMTGEKDKYHLELTKKIELKIIGNQMLH